MQIVHMYTYSCACKTGRGLAPSAQSPGLEFEVDPPGTCALARSNMCMCSRAHATRQRK